MQCGVVSSLWICVIALQPTFSIMQSALHGAVEGRARALLYLPQPPWQHRGAAAHSSVSARLQSVELVRHTSGCRKGEQWLVECVLCCVCDSNSNWNSYTFSKISKMLSVFPFLHAVYCLSQFSRSQH